ncbi:MAG: hypothetical protein ACLFUH_08765 [Bacteroidales bacterium]
MKTAKREILLIVSLFVVVIWGYFVFNFKNNNLASHVSNNELFLDSISTSHHKPQVLASYKTPKWKQVIECESDWRHYNKSGYLLEGDQHLPRQAYGIAQFQVRTFRELKNKAGKPELRLENKEDQIWLLKWAIKNGYGKKWSCY